MTERKVGHFHGQVLHAFVKILGIYPTGTLVKLHSDHSAKKPDQAGDQDFLFLNSRARIPTRIIDLNHSGDTIESIEHPKTRGSDRTRIMTLLQAISPSPTQLPPRPRPITVQQEY